MNKWRRSLRDFTAKRKAEARPIQRRITGAMKVINGRMRPVGHLRKGS